jgi:hypothetical protein
MKRYSGAWLLSATTAVMLFVLSACTSPNDAGKDVLPQDENIKGYYVDTFSIFMNTLREDSTQTYKLSRCLFGNYYDEQFGQIFAETYIQPRVQGSNLTFGADPAELTLDSIVLTLDLTGFYGRYDDPLPLHIYEITQAFDTSLYSQSTLTADLSYDLARGYKVDFSGRAGFFDFITIRLDDSIGNKLLHAPTSDLASNEFFTNYFRGLLIRSESVNLSNTREPGGIFYFDPRGEKSFLKMYYKDSTAAKTYTFPINANSERFHHIERTNWQGRLLEQSILPQADNGVTYGCVEAGALVNLYVGIPTVQSLDPAIINRATLVLKVDPEFTGSDDRFVPPNEVYLFVANSAHTKPRDLTVRNSFGSYSKATGEYRIPMTNTLQQILSGALPNNGFVIVPAENGVSMNRVVFGGPGHPTLAPKLEVIYTSLPPQ